MKEHRPKQGENGGKWRNSEAQRSAAFVGVRNKRVCKGMRSDTEEGLQLQMVWGGSSVKSVKCAVRSAVKEHEGRSGSGFARIVAR